MIAAHGARHTASPQAPEPHPPHRRAVSALEKSLQSDIEWAVLTQIAAVRGAVQGLMMEVSKIIFGSTSSRNPHPVDALGNLRCHRPHAHLCALRFPHGIDRVTASNVSFSEATRTWLRIGLLSFGGPAGQIAVMHRILVERSAGSTKSASCTRSTTACSCRDPKRSSSRPISAGCCTARAAGWSPGILFVLPGFVAILALSIAVRAVAAHPLVEGLFFGLKAAVIALVVEARDPHRHGARCKSRTRAVVAVLRLRRHRFLRRAVPAHRARRGVLGYLRRAPARRCSRRAGRGDRRPADVVARSVDRRHARSLKLLALWLPLWFAPVAAVCDGCSATGSVLHAVGRVLQQDGRGHIRRRLRRARLHRAAGGRASRLADARANAGRPRASGNHARSADHGRPVRRVSSAPTGPRAARTPLLAGVLGSLVTVWVTFVPCFLWIFLGAPYIEALRGNVRSRTRCRPSPRRSSA